jgi:dynein heavy chain 2
VFSLRLAKSYNLFFFLKTPGVWQDRWEGPEDPMFYLKTIVEHFKALEKWCKSIESSDFFQRTMDLSELFRPDVFLNSLRQHSARDTKISMDELKLVCSWNGPIRNAQFNVKIGGLQLEGCNFNGTKLMECDENSPGIVSLPECYISWIPKSSKMPYDENSVIPLPVYFNSNREKIITKIDMPCTDEPEKWLLMGVALILKQI